MSTFDGGPAFPVDERVLYDSSGMTLRDWFAGQAIVALFAATAHPQHPGIGSKDYDGAGMEAYRIADAMLKARGAELAPPQATPVRGGYTKGHFTVVKRDREPLSYQVVERETGKFVVAFSNWDDAVAKVDELAGEPF